MGLRGRSRHRGRLGSILRRHFWNYLVASVLVVAVAAAQGARLVRVRARVRVRIRIRVRV